MKHRTITIFMLISILVTFIIFSVPFAEETQTPEGIERLKKQIESIIRGVEGEVGVAVKHLGSGEDLYMNGDTHFPMASVFKIPILVEVMAQIEEDKFALEDVIHVQKTDQHLGSGMLSDLTAPGITLSIGNLVNLMMMISDNSATDILLTKVRAENVNRRLRGYGIEDITVNRTCQNLILDILGVDRDKYKGLTGEEVITALRAEQEENPEAFKDARENFSKVLKDQSSPRAMNRLLEMIFNKEILDEESCDLILSIMLKCQTGKGRIKGDLPRGTEVAHKTGTIGGTVNDSGIIYLPDNLGHVAITVFTKDMALKTSEVEDIIAQIARFVYDYFYFTMFTVKTDE
ncbi:MAG: serine hydrolase [Candidatus Aminicenantaceae bacterium]